VPVGWRAVHFAQTALCGAKSATSQYGQRVPSYAVVTCSTLAGCACFNDTLSEHDEALTGASVLDSSQSPPLQTDVMMAKLDMRRIT
jgi:hypothetical protein